MRTLFVLGVHYLKHQNCLSCIFDRVDTLYGEFGGNSGEGDVAAEGGDTGGDDFGSDFSSGMVSEASGEATAA